MYKDISINSDKSVGSLYTSDNPKELGEDMLEIQLDNGLLLVAGWSPEGSQYGAYTIELMKDLDIIATRITTDVHQAADIISELVNKYNVVPNT